jgi:hypothetical protein
MRRPARVFGVVLLVAVLGAGGAALAATRQRGQLVRGDVFVDDNQAALGAVNEITAIPYEYRVR